MTETKTFSIPLVRGLKRVDAKGSIYCFYYRLLVKFLCAIDQLLAVDQWICVYDERIHPAALWEDAKLKG
jgi:hypothetical protein